MLKHFSLQVTIFQSLYVDCCWRVFNLHKNSTRLVLYLFIRLIRERVELDVCNASLHIRCFNLHLTYKCDPITVTRQPQQLSANGYIFIFIITIKIVNFFLEKIIMERLKGYMPFNILLWFIYKRLELTNQFSHLIKKRFLRTDEAKKNIHIRIMIQFKIMTI